MGINLLPEEFKAKSPKLGKVSVESKYLLYLIAAAFAVLISAHICLVAIGITKFIQFKALSSKWEKLKPDRQSLENLKKEYAALTYDNRIVQALNSRRLNWSEKFNRLSTDLPTGVWFNEILVSKKGFSLKASVVSLQNEEMSLINKFINNLKDDVRFMGGLEGLELGSVQKRSLGGYDVVDFILTAKLKAK